MLRRLFSLVVGLVTRRRAERELDEELRFHVAMETEANVARGKTSVEARRTALRDLGGQEQTKEAVRDVRGLWVDSVRLDLCHAMRRVRREPGFAATVVATIGLAVGLSTSVFSVASGVLLRPLSFRQPDRLVQVWRTLPEWDRVAVSVPEYIEWKERCRSFAQLAATRTAGFRFVAPDHSRWIDGLAVTPNLFLTLGVEPLIGRTFLPHEDQPGHNRVVLLDEGFWRTAFGGDPRIVGKRLRLADGGPRFTGPDTFEVIGVVPAAARIHYRTPSRCDFYVPLTTYGLEMQDSVRGAATLWVLGRLRPDVTIRQAEAEVGALFANLSRSFIRDAPGAGIRVVGLHEELLGHTRPAFTLLAGAVLILILIACSNLANLILSSGFQRSHELSARLSLGCSRFRLVRQLVTEHLLLAVFGGILGLALALWAVPSAVKLAPPTLPRLDGVHVDLTTFAFGAVVTCFTGLLSSLAPAVLLSRGGPRGTSIRQPAPFTRSRLRGSLMFVQAALMVVLLAGAALVTNSLWRLSHVDLGFDPSNVLTMRMVWPKGYAASGRHVAFQTELLATLSTDPRVIVAGTATDLPFQEGGLSTYLLEDQTRHQAAMSGISPDLLRALRVPLVAGRMLTAADQTDPHVCVVNQRLAQQIFPRGNAIGQRIGFMRWFEIVGVVGDVTEVGALRNGTVREAGLNRLILPRIYAPASGVQDGRSHLVVRTRSNPAALVPAVLARLAATDPEVAVLEPTTLDEMVGAASVDMRFLAALLNLFSGVSVVVAGIGLFGVVTHTVTRRTREFGVRLALGATRGHIRILAVGQALGCIGAGLGVGVIATVWGGRVLKPFLFELSPTDPVMLCAVAVLALAGAAAAAYLPARRASLIDPAQALRCD